MADNISNENPVEVSSSERVVKCICMSSGGLDSLLTREMVKRAAKDCIIEPVTVTVRGPFWGDIEDSNVYLDVDEGYFSMLKSPDHGYGKNMNPCKDCKIYMLRRAKKYMEDNGAEFVATGEVIGQRPNSQMKPSLNMIAEESGLNDKLLRPLSGKLFPASSPEKEGIIDRTKLGNISGRGRSQQFEYAKEYGITKYPSPAGGCRLTDKAFSDKIKLLFECFENINWFECEVVRKGRLIKFSPHGVLIVGRNHEDNEYLLNVCNNYADESSEYRKSHPDRKSANPFCILLNHKTTDKRPFIACIGEKTPTDEALKAMKSVLSKYSSNPEDKVVSEDPLNATDKNFTLDLKKEPKIE